MCRQAEKSLYSINQISVKMSGVRQESRTALIQSAVKGWDFFTLITKINNFIQKIYAVPIETSKKIWYYIKR